MSALAAVVLGAAVALAPAADTYGIGGVASYQGWLYWGSMHVPLQATKSHQAAYPQDTEEAERDQIRFTQRAATIWRGKDLGLPTHRPSR
ncbi:hypothetical protein [Actinoplanes sp. N902-109]|uniref:hypothetical protein n=1 Tax=Actinoplanes sp. (strain N902-109) TaxID=649831 RepID=UPI0003294E48|nr:hypothetical protein [Actinoplanes sp. N902-109]AGL21061.1 hypothetical protein L083_7551 [Actinoplanes sp. N902-109]